MKMYYCVFIVFTAFTFIEIVGIHLQNKILNYFKSDTVRTFERQWQKYKVPMENAVLLALKEIYGHKGMNVYIRKMRDPHKINKGYYHSDNQVQIILTDLELDNLPHIWMPQLTFPLPSNVLRVDASLSKMIVRCNYTVFRNKSDIIYDSKDQNFYKNSPFTFQQTKTIGQLGIIIEGCVLSGFTVATLNGPSVNLGYDNFNLYNCHHTFEIYNSGMQAPPVFASYYPDGEGLNIEQLLMTSLREELMPKLQAAMFSYVNTTAIFGTNLPLIRDKQEDIFRQTATFMNDVTRNMNKITVEKNIATVPMEDFKIIWDDLLTEHLLQEVKLNKMVLTGLDTAYSSHTGGPISVPVTCLAEEIRFERLQIYGIADFKGDKHVSHNFSVEIKDTTVSVLMTLNILRKIKRAQDKDPLKPKKEFEVSGCRSLEFSASGDEIISIEALVSGYLLKILPKYITEHLHRVYYEAVNKANSKSHGVVSNIADENNTEGLLENKEADSNTQEIQGTDIEEKSGQDDRGSQSKQGVENGKEINQTDDDLQGVHGLENGEEIGQGNSDSKGIQEAESRDEQVQNDNDSQDIENEEKLGQVNSNSQDIQKTEKEQDQSNKNSQGNTREENEEEVDGSENDGVLSESSQNENNTLSTSDKDETQEKKEGGINETEGLKEGDNPNSTSDSADPVNFGSEQEALNSATSSENKSPGEVKADDIETITRPNQVKDHSRIFKNKSITITSSETVHVNFNNTSRGDLVHLFDNEIRSDF